MSAFDKFKNKFKDKVEEAQKKLKDIVDEKEEEK